MRKFKFLVVVVLVIWAFLLGYWPLHKQVQAIEQENVQLKKDLASSQSLGRIARLQNELLVLIEQTEGQNYGEAQKLSNSFFDEVRKEIDRDKSAFPTCRNWSHARATRCDHVRSGAGGSTNGWSSTPEPD